MHYFLHVYDISISSNVQAGKPGYSLYCRFGLPLSNYDTFYDFLDIFVILA